MITKCKNDPINRNIGIMFPRLSSAKPTNWRPPPKTKATLPCPDPWKSRQTLWIALTTLRCGTTQYTAPSSYGKTSRWVPKWFPSKPGLCPGSTLVPPNSSIQYQYFLIKLTKIDVMMAVQQQHAGYTVHINSVCARFIPNKLIQIKTEPARALSSFYLQKSKYININSSKIYKY